jgi:predicted alpha/beta hydrolase family esterase
MVGIWARADGLTNGTEEEAEQFKNLFPPEGFDFAKIKTKADDFLYLHGSDDPYCPIDQARWIAEQTGGDFVEVPNGHHLGSRFKELPVLLKALETR